RPSASRARTPSCELRRGLQSARWNHGDLSDARYECEASCRLCELSVLAAPQSRRAVASGNLAKADAAFSRATTRVDWLDRRARHGSACDEIVSNQQSSGVDFAEAI